MVTTMNDILHPGAMEHDPSFPYAPDGWTKAGAEDIAKELGIALGEDHWEVIRVLQGCYTDEKEPRIRLLCDALKARFGKQGGIKYIYDLFPEGPLTQGCRLAGVKAPAGSVDEAQGSAL